MKQITFFDPRCTDAEHPNGQQLTVTASTNKEYADNRTAILDPTRGITLIDPPELPEEPDPSWFSTAADQLRADLLYLSIMTGVDLDE